MQHTTLAAALLAALSANALANTQALLPPAEFTLDEIVVTATRSARTVDETLAAVTVLTRRDIEKATSLQALLAGSTGVTLANNGGAGKETSVYLRGAQANHAVVLIDGIKVGSATKGVAAYQDIPLDAIERIEIVRGPTSSLYGSEAIGGVIQIFTRKGAGTVVSAGVGRYGTKQLAASLGGNVDTGWYRLAAGHDETDGFSAQNGTETDNDGYRNRNVSLRGGLRLGSATEAEFSLLHAAGAVEYDGTSSNEGKSGQFVGGGHIKHRIGDLWQTRLSLGQSHDDSDSFLNGVFKSRFNTRRNSAAWLNDLTLSAQHLLTVGVDWQHDKVDSTTAYTVTKRDNTGLFAQWQGRLGAQDVRLALRRDENSQFGGHTTGNAAWGVDITPGLRARLAYGTAFNAPTFNQLYYPGFGNAALQPEESESVEAGLSGRGAGGQWSATLFDNRITNLISFDGTTNPSNASARIRGLELDWKTRLAAWDARIHFTLQDPENTSNTANKGKDLNRRARESLRIDLDRELGSWRIGTTLRGEGKRYDNLANTTKLSGYGLIDLRAETRLAKEWVLAGRVENLLDKRYYTVAGYNQPGAGLYLTLRWQPTK